MKSNYKRADVILVVKDIGLNVLDVTNVLVFSMI